MLTELLRLLADQEAQSTLELADRLGVPDVLVHAMLETLTRQGYLHTVMGCASNCGTCAPQSACALPSGHRAWLLTERGRRFLQSAR